MTAAARVADACFVMPNEHPEGGTVLSGRLTVSKSKLRLPGPGPEH